MPQGDPRPGEKYLHFKNRLYQVTAIAQHSETGEKLVIYQALYGTFQTYARPLSMFISPVDREKYPQVKQKYRFQWVEFKKTEPAEEKRPNAGIPDRESEREKVSGTGISEQKPEMESGKEKSTDIEVLEREPVKDPSRTEVPVKEAVPKTSRKGMSTEEKMLAFFDADTAEDRYQILVDMQGEVTDRMINNMAVVLDVVIEEGPLDLRYEELKACLRTMQRYECSRLRAGRGN